MNLLVKLIGWLRLALVPAMVAFAIGYAVYTLFPGEAGLLAAFLITIAGLCTGLVWATVSLFRSGNH